MRRKDREISDRAQQFAILSRCAVCRVGMIAEGKPYIVPLNFGIADRGDSLALYFHCAHEGKKLDALRAHPEVCFEVDCGHQLNPGETACQYAFRYESVIGEGTMSVVTDPAEKAEGLAAMMRTQAGKEFAFTAEQTAAVTVLRLDVWHMTGKSND